VFAAAKHTALAAATLVALLAVTIVGAAGGTTWPKRDREAPTPPANVHVVAAGESAVSVAWDAARDNVGVAGYYVYGDGSRYRASSTGYTVHNTDCGQSISIEVIAYDAANNRSPRARAIVSTAPCPDVNPPSVPSGFRQTATTQSSAMVEWAPSSDDVGVVRYGVYRGAQLVQAPVSPTAALTGLSCESTTQFQVDAVDAAGNRSARSSVWVGTAQCSDGQAPSAPGDLAVTGRTGTTVSLSWSASTDDVGVEGYRLSVGNVAVATVGITSATATGLTCGTSYSFGVDAYDAAGNRSETASVTALTSACAQLPPPPPTGDTTPPSPPTALTVNASTASSVSLGWTPATDNIAVTGYDILVNGVTSRTVTSSSATVAGLACGTAYQLGVEALDAAGNRSTRASLTSSTAPCVDTQAPTAPQNVVATTRSETSIALSWAASTDNVGVTAYGLFRGGVLQGTSSGTTGVLSGLTCNTNYTLAVDARDAAGNASGKTTVMVATTSCPDTAPPAMPTGLTASGVTQSGLTLSWNASNDNVGVTGYDVYRNGTKVATSSTTSSPQTGLACGTSYTFGVVARDAAGNSSAAAQTSTSTSACSAPPPPPPSSEWAFCANEGQQCTFAGTKDVRYGANGTFTAPRTFTSSVNCDNSVFGDPAVGTVKRCEYRDATGVSTPPPPPPSGGTAVDDFTDIKNNVFTQIFEYRWAPPSPTWTVLGYVGHPWDDGSGVFELSTPHGPGFRIVQNEDVPRGSGALVGMADVDHFVDQQNYLGTVTDFSGMVMFPRSGNPNGFPQYGDWNLLWEFTQNHGTDNAFGVDALAPGGPTLYATTFNPSNPGTDRKARASSPIEYDRWYSWRWQVKWSSGSDGYSNFWVDGQQIAAFTGQTVNPGLGPPYIEWGFYGGYSPGRNEIQYAAVRKN
jgi:chitodextrinase